MRKITSTIGSWITHSNNYIENLDLFTVAMGQYTDEALEYAEQVGELVGINPSEWIKNQGIFMTLATGFGVASDRAAVMSRNLTQLGYDISALHNISFEDAMTKLQSGLAGELEPLRRVGYDLSNARLQQEAYTLGIKKRVSAMNQAEKAELRHYTIMTQNTLAQGSMARTLENPANQLRILKAQVEQTAQSLGTSPVKNAFSAVTTDIGGFFTSLWSGIQSTFTGVANWFKSSVTDPIANFFKSAINTVISALNTVIKAMNKLSFEVPDWVPGIGGETWGFNVPTIPMLASGGFVSSGQLFMARENGLAEMVGAFGNRTAVANNDQIVAGISSGVFNAVRAAMSGISVRFVMDTSAMKFYDSNFMTPTVAANGSNYHNNSTGDMKQAVLDALIESGLVSDVRRQADKQEQTVLTVDGRRIAETVTTQQRKNGFRFVTA